MTSRWMLVGALASLTACAGGNTENAPPGPQDSGQADTGVVVTDIPVAVDRPVTPMDTGNVTVNCLALTNCSTCAAIGPCGWCGANNTCLPGGPSGPTAAGVCAGGWSGTALACPLDAGNNPTDTGNVTPVDTGNVTPTDAGNATDGGPDPCATSATCGACTARSSCGFCGATGLCQTGRRDGPSQGPSCASGWAWLSSECGGASPDAGDPCASATDCGSCTSRSQCGWCPGANRCLVGTSTGPNTNPGQCGTWAWYTGQCGGGPTDAGAPTDTGPRDTGPADTGNPTDVPGGMGIGGFGDPATFNASDVQRACPQGATMRLQIVRVYALPTRPNGTAWDSIPGVTDFLCQAPADRVREVLRDQINGIRMGTGDQADRAAGDAFRNVVSQQCGQGVNWFLGRWAGPDMYAQFTTPPSSTVMIRTPTEDDSWEAPRQGVTWPTAVIEAPCSGRSTVTRAIEIRDEELFSLWESMGTTTITMSQVSPRGLCSGYAWREGFAGIAGMLFRVTVTGGTQDCQGIQ